MNSLVAVVLSSLFAAGFVGSIYFAPSHLEPLSRNHPQKAFWRMKAIGLVSLVTTVVICALLCFVCNVLAMPSSNPQSVVSRNGMLASGFSASARSLCLLSPSFLYSMQ